MTQKLDEKALNTAVKTYIDQADDVFTDDGIRAAILAYLAALPPPVGEVGELVERLGIAIVWPPAIADTYADALTPKQIEMLYASSDAARAAADMLTTQAARLAECERERDEMAEMAAAHEQKWQTLCGLTLGTCACSYDQKDAVCSLHSPKLAAAEARLAELAREKDKWVKTALDSMEVALREIAEIGTREHIERVGDMYDLENGYEVSEVVSPEAEIARAALADAPADTPDRVASLLAAYDKASLADAPAPVQTSCPQCKGRGSYTARVVIDGAMMEYETERTIKCEVCNTPAPVQGDGELVKAAQDVLDEVDKILSLDPPPIKYRAPYGSLARLRAALNAYERPAPAPVANGGENE